MSSPVLDVKTCRLHPFKSVANISYDDLMRLKGQWDGAVAWCSETFAENVELLEWIKRERDKAVAYMEAVTATWSERSTTPPPTPRALEPPPAPARRRG
jgi:hypothetical protein